MSEEYGVPIWAYIAVGLVFFFFWMFGFISGRETGLATLRTEAIKNQAAYYSVNPSTGETKFNWGQPLPEKEGVK